MFSLFKYCGVFLFSKGVLGLDLRTGGGGIGLDGYQIHQSDSGSSCPIIDGTIASLSCVGVTPYYDMAAGESSVSVVGDGIVFEVFFKHLPFRDFSVITSHREMLSSVDRKRLTFHLIDSNEFTTCEEFVISPTGIEYCEQRGVSVSDCLVGSLCSVRHSGLPETLYDSCAQECQLPRPETQSVHVQRRTHTKQKWDFNEGLEGWANATSSEMKSEIYALGGELRGIVLGSSADGRYVARCLSTLMSKLLIFCSYWTCNMPALLTLIRPACHWW